MKFRVVCLILNLISFAVLSGCGKVAGMIKDLTGDGAVTESDDMQFSIEDPAPVLENGGTITFTIVLDSESSQTTSVDYQTSNSTASSGSHYTAKSGTLTFEAGQTSQTVTVPITHDGVATGDLQFYLNLSNPSSTATFSDSTAIGTITNIDAPTISSISPSASPLAGGSTVTITGTGFLSGPSIEIGGQPCSAINLLSSTSLTCTSPAHSAGTYSATLTNTTLSQPSGVRSGSGGSHLYTASALSIDDPTNVEASGVLVFTITIAPTSASNVTVDWSTVSGSATSGVDFTSASGTATIGAGSPTATVTITLNDEAVAEGDETVSVQLANATNASITDSTGIGTITNDDTPTISGVSPGTGPDTGGTSITITGTGFLTGATATVGGASCVSPILTGTTQIVCTTSAGTAGSSDVVVNNTAGAQPSGTRTVTSVGAFFFEPSAIGVWSSMTTTGAPSGRTWPVATWSGTHVFVWGGTDGVSTYYNDGALYNPVTDSWSPITTTGAPAVRAIHAAVWTGTQFFVWGGYSGGDLGTGGLYNPATDAWVASTSTSAPSARRGLSMLWTGTQALVWGGSSNTGAIYNPRTDSWSAMATPTGLEARYMNSAEWTGTQMLIWGGGDVSAATTYNNGAIYTLASNSWSPITSTATPTIRRGHASGWTGSKLLVWGGGLMFGTLYNDGAMYDLASDSWTPITQVGVPSVRKALIGSFSAWTGTWLLVWGGSGSSGYLNDGALFDPVQNMWTPMTSTGAPGSAWFSRVTWIGEQALIWRGSPSSSDNVGAIFTPRALNDGNTWAAATSTNVPAVGTNSQTTWTGSRFFVWGGAHWLCCTKFNVGGLYDPQTDRWSSVTTTNAPAPRAEGGVVWSGHQAIVWGGMDSSNTAINTGGVYNPATDSWSAMTTTGAPTGRGRFASYWIGDRALFWGGSYNTGGLYNPQTDSWTAITTTGAPTAGSTFSAVTWTGSRLMVFGPSPGKIYDPYNNSWSTMTTTNAPVDRTNNATVWIGHRLLVWGGYTTNFTPVNSGGIYDPVTNAWSTITSVGAPQGTDGDTMSAWSGTRVAFWNRYSFNFYGGLYDPINDSWSAITSAGAPAAAFGQRATWTGARFYDSSSRFFYRPKIQDIPEITSLTPATGDPTGGYTLTIDGTDFPASPTPTVTVGGLPCSNVSIISSIQITCLMPTITDGDLDVVVTYPDGYVGRVAPGSEFHARIPEAWTLSTTTGRPSSSIAYKAAWTGSTLLVWGGYDGSLNEINTGGRYDPVTDSWASMTTISAPARKTKFVAAWTGQEFIVWGGESGPADVNTGGKYDPLTDTWSETTTTGAPTGVSASTAVWTGKYFVVHGGISSGVRSNAVGRYLPESDTWVASTGSSTARASHSSVWSGRYVIVWGGETSGTPINTGERYDPLTNTWSTIAAATIGARKNHSAVWTGREMIIWGGFNSSAVADGSRYNPATNAWTAITTTGEPSARVYHGFAWTGSRVLVTGGQGSGVYSDGAAYDPTSDTWTPMTAAPLTYISQNSFWTGRKAVFCSGDSSGARIFNYSPTTIGTGTWSAMTAGPSTLGSERAASVWTGSQMVVWAGVGLGANGGRYDPISNSWTAMATASSPGQSWDHRMVWTGKHVISWGGDDNSTPQNDGGLYDPIANTWTAMTTTGAPSGRSNPLLLWMGDKLMVTAGSDGSGGKLYDPVSNSWSDYSSVGAPVGFGGSPGQGAWNGTYALVSAATTIAGLYNPRTDTWTAVTTTGARGGPYFWTGSKFLAPKGLYDPATDTWSSTTTVGRPTLNESVVVWTGSKLLVWGGTVTAFTRTNNGAIYDPNVDIWLPMNVTGAPSARARATGVWTGRQFIVWSGIAPTFSTNTGGVYTPVSSFHTSAPDGTGLGPMTQPGAAGTNF